MEFMIGLQVLCLAPRMSAGIPSTIMSRRATVLAIPPCLLAISPSGATEASAFSELTARLDSPVVAEAFDKPMEQRAIPSLPDWMAGSWQLTQTLTSFTLPLGVQYIGAPGRPLSEAESSAAETRAQIGKPVTLEVRYMSTPGGGAIEDRAFNARSRLDAFAGRPVTKSSRSCAEANVDASSGLACTFIDFTGPVAQKQVTNSLRVATSPTGRSVVYSEFTRSVFARKTVPGDTRNFPPITTDAETVVSLAPDPSGEVLRGRLRLISYLQPYDPLYFAAGRKSVSISDYSLTLTRLQPSSV